jgi:hypothetical protein
MKNFKVSLLFLFVLMLAFYSCSKKGADKIIGKWKMDTIENIAKKGITFDLTYEFTKDTMSFDGTMKYNIDGKESSMPQPKIKIPFIVKSDDGTNVVIEATHPFTKEKGEFKLNVNDNKMVMTDPKQVVFHLTKI